MDEVVAEFKTITQGHVTDQQRRMLAARARDLGPADLTKRMRFRFATRGQTRDLLKDIEQDDWDETAVPGPRPRTLEPEDRLSAAPEPAGHMADPGTFAERMARHGGKCP